MSAPLSNFHALIRRARARALRLSLRPRPARRSLEYLTKRFLLLSGLGISCVPPELYKRRFISNVVEAFIEPPAEDVPDARAPLTPRAAAKRDAADAGGAGGAARQPGVIVLPAMAGAGDGGGGGARGGAGLTAGGGAAAGRPAPRRAPERLPSRGFGFAGGGSHDAAASSALAHRRLGNLAEMPEVEPATPSRSRSFALNYEPELFEPVRTEPVPWYAEIASWFSSEAPPPAPPKRRSVDV